jgi:hypothetical protein
MTRLDPERSATARFASAIVFTKREAFALCEVIAEAERLLLREGMAAEAARLASLFELVEGRLVNDGPLDPVDGS